MMENNYFKEKIINVLEQGVKKGSEKIVEKAPGIFIPGKGKLYDNMQDKKVLYIGIDTNGWGEDKGQSLKRQIEEYKAGKKDQIVEEIMKAANDRLASNEHVEWYKEGSQFWDFIFKMQAKLLNIPFEKENISEQITQSFAWGNSYLLQTINLEDEVKNSDEYAALLKIANEGEETRNLLFDAMDKMFDPDIIIILNWGEYMTFLDEEQREEVECTISINEKESSKRKLKVELYKVGNKKIVWTYHPRAMSFCGGVNQCVEKILKASKFLEENKN